MHALILVALGISLAGCASSNSGVASLTGGACKAFDRPPYAIKGATPYDQAWADDQVEAGVGGCGWARPKPRPASLDKPKALTVAPVAIKPKKKPGFFKRLVS